MAASSFIAHFYEHQRWKTNFIRYSTHEFTSLNFNHPPNWNKGRCRHRKGFLQAWEFSTLAHSHDSSFSIIEEYRRTKSFNSANNSFDNVNIFRNSKVLHKTFYKQKLLHRRKWNRVCCLLFAWCKLSYLLLLLHGFYGYGLLHVISWELIHDC